MPPSCAIHPHAMLTKINLLKEVGIKLFISLTTSKVYWIFRDFTTFFPYCGVYIWFYQVISAW